MKKNLLAFLLGAAIATSLIVVLELSDATTEVSRRVAVETIPDLDPRALVVLEYVDRRQNAIGTTRWTRVAFAIGDGTLLLTAAHCVDDFQQPSNEPISTDMVVISPYYGDVFGFEILALDREADLAVLRAPWPTHPALALAGEAELAAAEEILIVSRPQANQQIGRDIRTELLPKLPTRRTGRHREVELKGTRQVARGWSGSALVLPDTGGVVGVATQLRTRTFRRAIFWRTTRQDAVGCGIDSIHRLLREQGLEAIAARRPGKLEPIAEAERGFQVAMDYFEMLIKHESVKLVESAQELVCLRPDSVQAHMLAAMAATIRAQDANLPHQEWLAQAEASYQRALEVDPNSAHVHAVYGNFLRRQGRRIEALAQSEAALALDPGDRLALLNRLSLLPPERTLEAAEQLIDIDPNDPYYWFYYSGSLCRQGQLEAGLAAARKAVDLDPNGLFHGALADALVALGRAEEAATYYRQMAERCGCQRCWYRYAAFLVGHCPEQTQEADRAVSMAESKAALGQIPQRDLNAVRLQILERTSPLDAETFARNLLHAAPGEALYWWHLASILRTQTKHREAAEVAAKAVELDPNAPYRARLANCLAQAGDPEAAQKMYDEMLERHPERSRYWYWYAEFLADHHPDRLDEAFAALEKAVAGSGAATSWSVPAADLAELRAALDSKVEMPPKN